MRFMKKNYFFETAYPDVTIGLEVTEKLYVGKSKFQKIEIYETRRLGKMLVLDGVVQTTVGDEFIYHEMMSHVPMCQHPQPEHILIIGGGDGGVAKEILKHASVQKVTLVEIDGKVVELCKKHMPEIAQKAWNNPKLEVRIEDGAKFIEGKTEAYDVVIVDSSDPVGPSTVLFSEHFCRAIAKSLKPGGILIRQSGSSFFLQEPFKELFHVIAKIFPITTVYGAAIPTYIGGFFTFVFASKTLSPLSASLPALQASYRKINGKTNYYTPELHLASFQLPGYISHMMGKA